MRPPTAFFDAPLWNPHHKAVFFPVTPTRTAKKSRVLIVDDDPIVLEVCRERLVAAGYEVSVRDQAIGTSRLIAQSAPDIVLLDVMMPALSGDELALILKRSALTKKIHIVLHSSKPEAELSGLIAQTGAIGAIQKADDAEEFADTFRTLVKRVGH